MSACAAETDSEGRYRNEVTEQRFAVNSLAKRGRSASEYFPAAEHMKSYIFRALIVLVLSGVCLADTITKNDGQVIEGKVIDQNAKTRLGEPAVEIQTNKGGIRLKLKVPKTEIKDLQIDGPDDIHFKEKIKDLHPTADRLDEAGYAGLILTADHFLERFPRTNHREATEVILTHLKKEQALVGRGQILFEGKWYSTRERTVDAYELEARFAIADLRSIITSLRPGELNMTIYTKYFKEFEKLMEDFAASENFPAISEIVVKDLLRYRALLRRDIANVPNALKEFQVALSRMKPADQLREKRAREQLDIRYKKAAENARKAGTKFLPTHEFHAKEMKEVQRAVEALVKSLTAPAAAPPTFAGPIFREAYADVLGGKIGEAKKKIQEMKALKVPERLLEDLNKRIAQREEGEDPNGRTKPITPRTPDEGEEGEKPKPKSTDASDNPSSESGSDQETEAPEAKKKKKGPPMQLILVVVLVIVIAGALIAAFAGRKKAS